MQVPDPSQQHCIMVRQPHDSHCNSCQYWGINALPGPQSQELRVSNLMRPTGTGGSRGEPHDGNRDRGRNRHGGCSPGMPHDCRARRAAHRHRARAAAGESAKKPHAQRPGWRHPVRHPGCPTHRPGTAGHTCDLRWRGLSATPCMRWMPRRRPRQPMACPTKWIPSLAGDEEARARGTQKSVLERKAPPTFPLVIEMRERAYWVTHWVEDSVDCLLHGKVPVVQVRCCRATETAYRLLCWCSPCHVKRSWRQDRLHSLCLHNFGATLFPGCYSPEYLICNLQQVRRRDLESRDVMIEERRYDKAGPEGGPTSSQSMRDRGPVATSPAESLDQAGGIDVGPPPPLPLQTLSAGFGSSFADDDASDNPYAWAQRLREIPDKVCYSVPRCLGNGAPGSSPAN